MPGHQQIRANIDGLMDAVNANDWAALAEWIDPEVEYTPVEEGVCHRGAEAFVEYFKHWYAVWENPFAEAEEVQVAADGDRAFVVVRFIGRGKGSSVPIEGRVFQVVQLRNGKYHRVAEFSDRDEAWAAHR
jgi:ketosteroid isomerase-like protein